jgi:hypothetical protein
MLSDVVPGATSRSGRRSSSDGDTSAGRHRAEVRRNRSPDRGRVTAMRTNTIEKVARAMRGKGVPLRLARSFSLLCVEALWTIARRDGLTHVLLTPSNAVQGGA